jgi:outer membrane protein TolC
MRPLRLLRSIALPFLLAATILLPPSEAAAEAIRLSLGDAVRRAVEGNPAYLASSWQPRIAETSVESARGAFDPAFNASVTGGTSRTAAPSGTADTSTLTAGGAISKLFGTGATLSLEGDSSWTRTDSTLATSSTVEPVLTAKLRQPLLKGAGATVTEGAVRTATLDLATSRSSLRASTLTLASQAIALYFGCARASDAVETRRSALESARRLDLENRARVRAGLLAEVELLESGLAIAQREADLVEAERARDTALVSLKAFLGLPPGADVEVEDHRLSPLPEIPPESGAADLAAAGRPDLEGARRALAAQEFRLRLSRDATLPSLDSVGQASLSGNDRGTSAAFGDVGEAKYPAWSLSLQFALPIGNRTARAESLAAEYRLRQARNSLDAAELQVKSETRNAYRAVEAKGKAEEAQGKAVTVASTRVESFRKKVSLGLATSRQLLDAETDLSTARLSLTDSQIDHRLARYEVLRSTGLLADRFGLYPPSPPPAPSEVK